MFAKERHQLILQALTDMGRVEVIALAAQWQVSEDTIRRDLREMAAQGLLHKTHGGAVRVTGPHAPMLQRHRNSTDAKARIGRAAAHLVRPGQTLILDAGSTTLELARHLQARPLRVITNALDIAALLADDADIELVLLGGTWNRDDRNFSGETALVALSLLRADIAFIGVCALDARMGVTADDSAQAQIKRAMVASAARSVLVADASKWGQVAPFAVAALGQCEQWITDQMPVDLEATTIRITVAA
jgi:DeoR/GlpR family transcriptional regulator of sugar metabolism